MGAPCNILWLQKVSECLYVISVSSILWRGTFTFYCIYLSIFWPHHKGSLFQDQGLNLCPLQWKGVILTTGLPRKSLFSFYFKPHALSLQKLFTFDASFLFVLITVCRLYLIFLSL